MAWLDYLSSFIPQGVTPQSYDYFRALYPPQTRGMPGQATSPQAPQMIPALPRPMQAPAPNEPQGGTFPGFGPQMTGDIRVGEGAPELPAGQLPWLSNMQQFMTGGTPTDGPGLSVRVTKPNVVPASNPPPTMPDAPVTPDTLGAINATPYGVPSAPSDTGRKPFDWGPDSAAWSPLMAAGAAMMQPTWYGLGGSLSQGLTAASEAARKGPMERLQRRLLEAQVGKTEQETDVRKQLVAIGQSLPKDHPARPFALLGLPKEFAEKMSMDPNKLFSIGPDGKPVLNQGYFDAEIALAKAKQPNVNVNTQLKLEGEAAGVDKLAQEYRAKANAATDPAEKARLMARADAYERRATIGDKEYPEKLRQQAVELGTGTNAASNLATLLNNPDISRLNPNDRAAIAQQFQNLNLAYATLKNRGANFTESEQKMIASLAGGDPNAWSNMALRTRQDFIKKLEIAHREMSAEWDRIKQAFARGEPMITPFPKFDSAPTSGRTKSGWSYERVP